MGQLRLKGVAARPSKNGSRWGGRREGAGRKPAGAKAGQPHMRRPPHVATMPLHVTLRLADGVPRMRQRRGYQAVRRAMQVANRFDAARICEISIQHNHVHLLVEANDSAALTRLMRSFGNGLAKNVRARLGKT